MTTVDKEDVERSHIEVSPDRARVRVHVRGTVDDAVAEALQDECGGLLERGFASMLLDLTGVTALPPAGIAAIAAILHDVRAHGSALTVIPGNEVTTGVLRRSGLLAQLVVAGSETTFFEWTHM